MKYQLKNILLIYYLTKFWNFEKLENHEQIYTLQNFQKS